MTRPPRIILADDHVLILEAIKNLLEADFKVVGTFTDGRALLDGAAELKPEVVVLDINMPNMNGLNAGQRLRQILPRVKLVFLTMNMDADMAAEAFRLGASGYVVKSSAATELTQAIRLALVGRTYLTPLIPQGDMPASFFHQVERNKKPNQLTLRQKEVLQLLVEGRSMKEVGHILNVTPRTVAFHKYSIMEHLHVHSNADLIRFAISNSLVATA